MSEYIMFMHNDAGSDDDGAWESYLPSVPIPKFVSICGTPGTNFGIEGTLANL